jgi:hypothetical protein
LDLLVGDVELAYHLSPRCLLFHPLFFHYRLIHVAVLVHVLLEELGLGLEESVRQEL